MPKVLGTVVATLLLAGMPAGVRADEAMTLEAVVVWQERSEAGDWDVHYAFVGRPGPGAGADKLVGWTPSGSVSAPLADLPGDDEDPAVAIGADGTVVAVWSNRPPDGPPLVHWSRLGPDGWSVPEPLAASATGEDPAVAVSGDTGLAVWSDPTEAGRPARYSVLRDGAWTQPGSLPGSREASLPEVAFLSEDGSSALAAHSGRDEAGRVRTHAASWDGSAWTLSSPVGLSAQQEAAMPEHASSPGGAGAAFSRLGLAPQRDGGAVVAWGSPVAEDWTHLATGVQGASYDPADGSWTPLAWRDGSVDVTEEDCEAIHSPAVAATGSGDVLVAFAGHGGLGFARRVRGSYSNGGVGPRTAADDVRPAVAPLADRVVAASWNNPYPWDPPAVISAVSISFGTLRPRVEVDGPTATWPQVRQLSVREARSPDVASVLGGTTSPLSTSSWGRGTGMIVRDHEREDRYADTDSQSATWTGTDTAGVRVWAMSTRVERGVDRAEVTVAVGEVRVASTPPILVRDLVVTAVADCGEGPSGTTTVGSVYAGNVRLAGTDLRRNTSAAAGVATVRVNTQQVSPSGLTVTGVTVDGPSGEIVIGTATAFVEGCPGTGPPAGSGGGHEH